MKLKWYCEQGNCDISKSHVCNVVVGHRPHPRADDHDVDHQRVPNKGKEADQTVEHAQQGYHTHRDLKSKSQFHFASFEKHKI